ncbi:MMS19 nucleotide excision repair protein homolog [Seminavis robusta]|uniref:MMS19 nucleotide excision repair protein n=1 Tax=Seminavis robusta TaxID=568900 RepID=A0A9N8DTH5_9STRA|nr:MMS19 nucleotide excision repair protein homolog [Seminavis robusta]|eukprot:Sro358_g125930.1 MMS19 nucleotide excision repair protein homolog (1230) ;mRNA; r:49006-52940
MESKFASWLERCQNVQKPDDAIVKGLQSEARDSFAAGSKNEKSLAKLFQTMGPGLTAESLPSRIYALSIICGAVEGCQQKSELTMATANLLRDFFLEQCGPIQEEDDTTSSSWGEDYGEQIRDTAVKCLSALLSCQLENSQGDLKKLTGYCVFYGAAAKDGVTRRCALAEDSQIMPYRNTSDVTNGLSTLPRSRRSLCFNLLQSAVVSVEHLVKSNAQTELLAKLAKKVESEMNGFVTFACTCMQGESDPRCLMQMLILLHKIQQAMQPLFNAGKLASFPIVAVFDSVAPYYPINFTPPPNDNHGITRKGLNDALMAVLCDSTFDQLLLKKKKNQDTMTSLCLGLVLERLMPVDGDDSNVASSSSEKKEALDDIAAILMPGNEKSSSSNHNFDCLHDASVQQLSNALIISHHEAAVGVLMGINVQDDKLLADSCRSLVSRIAACLETVKDKKMWTVFVKDSVTRMAAELDKQNEGRIAIAYLAALVTSGAPQTIRVVMDSSVGKLITVVKGYSSGDEEAATLAAFGIGAFFSASKVAMDKALANGFVINPHPVDAFGSKAFQALYSIYVDSNASTALRTASVFALDSVLRVSSFNGFEITEQVQIGEFVSQLASGVLQATDTEEELEKDALDLVQASANTLGGMVGKALADDNSQGEGTAKDNILQSDRIKDVLKSKVLVDLLFRARQGTHTKSKQRRFDRIALARACSSSLAAATAAIEALLHALRDSLSADRFDSRVVVARAGALSYVLKHGGDVAARALHELSAPSVTVHDVLQLLWDLDPRKAARLDGEEDQNMTSLDLPPTSEEVQRAQQMNRKIVSSLLPAYTTWVPKAEAMKLLSQVSNILPPLSDGDSIKLSILLPLLAAALENGNLPQLSSNSAAFGLAISTCSELAQYTLDSGYEPASRTAAASCLYSYIVNFSDRTQANCTAKQLLVEVVTPALIDASNELREPNPVVEGKVVDCLNLCSIVGSAAAAMGGKSVNTADELSKFFVLLACNKKAEAPFSETSEIDFSKLGDESLSIMMTSAECFGSFLCHGKSPIWTQRQSHKAMKLLEPTMKLAAERQTTTSCDVGFIAILCHIVCSGNIKCMSLSDRGHFVKLIVQSLVSGLFDSDNLKTVKKLVVASVMKLLHLYPGLLSNYIESAMVGLLRAFAGAPGSDPVSDIACKLLILQVMESLCHIEIRKKALLAIKPAINSILSVAMNHPSRAIREASVRVQNTWYTLE